AIRYYKQSIQLNSTFYPPAHYFVAKLLINEGRYQEAEDSFRTFINFPEIDEYSKHDAERNILNCQFALTALQNPIDFQPINMGENINSIYSEYFPTMTVDGNFFLYTRRLGKEGQHEQEDFYVTIKNSRGNWVHSQNMGISINTPMNEGAATISADGKTIIFTACEQNGVYGYNRNGYGSCDLFFTRRIGNRWSKPTNLGPPINTANWESQPSLSSDGESLYFVRGIRRGNRRESDIFVSTLDKDGYWSTPQKLPACINTEEAEESVLIHPDDRTLYFSSRGHIGMGGSDIYICKKDENNEWGTAVNLGYPINTHKDENSLLVNPKGEIGYFASDREGGFGGLDIYAFLMPESIKPEPVTYFKGVVYDSLSRDLLGAEIELIDMITSETLKKSYSESGSGQFFLTLNPNHDYIINVSKDGYLFYSDAFLINGNYDQLEPFIKDVPLLPIQVGSSIILKNIFFETDKSELKVVSYTELIKLQEFLENNINISIEIAGHTDQVGSHEYNKQLSENRAKAVYDYLIEKGIESSRLKYKGYSFDYPISSNETEEGRAQNRRTEFIITDK
ncbi:MAG: OmpA family protein, partial [Bacteroidales bacterium]|nr:OmpA family protein [Bacteroidales bacterium]